MKHNYASYPPLSAIILGCFLFCNTITAQYVTIPDTTFVNWLTSNGYAGCMSGSQLDTTCSAVVNATSLECSSVPIRNLSGVQYFKNLTYLGCGNDSLYSIPSFPPLITTINCLENNLSSIPPLPTGLQEINCGYNPLTTLPALPSTLLFLTCSYDRLSTLPALPSGIVQIDCNNNLLVGLPTLPTALNILDCSYNSLTSLPALPAPLNDLNCTGNVITSLPSLPAALQDLDCGNNHLTALPQLPAALQYLLCTYNTIASIPVLPAGLQELDCSANSITSLPVLPSGLTHLGCGTNQLTNLPPMPDSLQTLYCYYNQLTSLPVLPATLTDLQCDYNQLTSIPLVSDSLDFFTCSNNPNLSCLPELTKIGSLDFSSTAVTCLPNYGSVYTSNPPLSSVPLCGIYNLTGCQPFWNVSGQCFYDENNDCIFDSVDVGTNYVKTMLYSGGTLIQQTFTGGEGFYSFDSVPYGNYTVQVDTSALPFNINCPGSGYYTVALSAADTFSFSNNFAFKCRQGFDIGVQSILNNGVTVRPNAVFTLNNTVGDISQLYGAHCAAGISGQVQLTYSGQVSYAGPAGGAITPTSVNGNTISWTIADYGAVNAFSAFNLLFKVDSLATPGTSLCFTITVTPTAGDYNPSNNTLSYCFQVLDALDPNEKEVYPTDSVSENNPWLTYTIRFQNTGTAPAVNVRITDTLDSNLDPSTFQLLAYSAKNLTQIFGNDVVFNFPNINLPDSLTSDSLSRGYVQYKIKLKDNLPVGTQIQNTADIYFDLNPAVATNTTVNTISIPAGIAPVSGELNMQLYPNPAKNYVIVETDESAVGGIIQITDITGREISKSAISSQQSAINTSALTGGVYLVKVSDLNGRSGVGKLVVRPL